MKSTMLIVVMLLAFNLDVFSQGCVAIRSNGGVCTMDHPMEDSTAQGWQLNTSYRYFRSFRHFRGNEEQKERLVQNTEVINWQNTLDLSLIRQLNNRWSVSVGLPMIVNKRSSLYEHGRTERHNSNSNGIGDIRVTANRWMVDPSKASKGNFQLGLGVKAPTGKAGATDVFYNVGENGSTQVRPVDQSIQLGDGGWGAITELAGYYSLNQRLSAYTNLYYLINPREQNGIRTFRETLSARLANEAIMSVPDQYMARLGVSYAFENKLQPLSLSAGGRIEGIPVYDLIGGSDGFRRPGYVVSAEPALSYKFKRLNFFAAVPVALYRDRTQSVTDKQNSLTTGTHVQGDAAFADYSVNLGFVVKF
ncbi:MAG TPA: hypothetical protein VGD90_09245 [Sphingobacteriaceae bacterium]